MARILVIEDHPPNLELMTYLLRAFGHHVLEAQDGLDGVIIARREKPDLIVCDVQLPSMDGYEVARQLKADADLNPIPVVAVTALAMVGDRERVLAGGFDGYISKPINPENFVREVEKFMAPVHASDQRPGAAAHTADGSPAAAGGTTATILVVDDIPVNIEVVRSTLEPFGYCVIGVATVRDALTSARQLQPDLIISDVHMPDESGYELLAAMKADGALRAIPLMFLASTPRHPDDRGHALSLGAAKFVLRPIEPALLIAAVEDCLR